MSGAARRVWGLVYRHLALYRRSWPRVLEMAYWPVLQLLVWGFVTRYLVQGQGEGGGAIGPAGIAAGALLGGVLLWEVALRGQMGFSLSFLEEIWSRNLGHLMVSPLRPRELVAALMAISVLRVAAGVGPAMLLALALYGFGLFAMGPVALAFLAALLLMGWWVALGVTAMVLRHGAGAEALAWSVLMGLTPFSAVFYPVSVLPDWARAVAWALPSSHVFEGMRAALDGRPAGVHLAWAFGLDALWMAAAAALFLRELRRARRTGALLNLGE